LIWRNAPLPVRFALSFAGGQVTSRLPTGKFGAAPPAALLTAAALLAAIPGAGWAHHVMDGALPATLESGFLSGLGHPLIGLDHAAFLFGAGFLLALVRHGLWGVAALIAGSLGGIALHLAGFNPPGAQAGVALSVVIAGGLVAARRRLDLRWIVPGLALAGVLHGWAYAEAIIGAETTPLLAYLAGLSLIQLATAAAAYYMHRSLMGGAERFRTLLPVRATAAALGVAVAGTGAIFLFEVFVA
jgi:urease accessory protein